MAHAQYICEVPPRARALRRGLFGELRALLAEWRCRARTRRGLAALRDRCLRDIGVTRYDAYREMHKPFWRA